MRKRIVFATIALHQMAGGLERNIIRIANYLGARGYDVSLLTFDLPEAESFYPIDREVKWLKLGRTRPHRKIGFFERLSLLSRIRNSFEGQDDTVLIVFHHGILLRLLLGNFGLGVKTICSERNALSLYNHIKGSKWNLNFCLLFLVSKIVVQFESYRRDYPFLLRSRISTISNVVEPVPVQANPSVAKDGRFRLLAMGRFCDQKNFAVLVGAFSILAHKFPDWDLVLVGEGSYRVSLEDQIKRLGLGGRIFLPGATNDTQSWFLNSHVYVMPSKWEGFPNALAEAMAHGLPAAGYRGCAGVRDLIEDQVSGFLAEGNGNSETLAVVLERLMSDPSLREKMGAAAKESMKAYLPENIYPQWENLLKDL